MNIFAFHKCAESAAEDHCNRHVVKMTIEYAQLLSTALYLCGANDARLYKPTHQHGRFVAWTMQSGANFLWLRDLWRATAQQYTLRYVRTHATYERMDGGGVFLQHYLRLPHGKLTPPPLGMDKFPQCVVNGGKTWDDVAASNRNYFNLTKQHIAKWKFHTPSWYKEE